MLFKLIARVKSIDHDAWNGRDLHPTDDMVGQEVVITKIEGFCENGFTEINLCDESQNHGDCPFSIFYGCLPDGRIAEFVSYELTDLRMEVV